MSTYVRLVDQTIRYTTPRIIPSFHKKKKRYSDRSYQQGPSLMTQPSRREFGIIRRLCNKEKKTGGYWFSAPTIIRLR
ncbi:hypothetical protein ERO13_A09G032266v2 [Gossypium hirsutum]|nr:hypothetical protein ERO13_A09G032266v2 [Gossypium hirsutum]